MNNNAYDEVNRWLNGKLKSYNDRDANAIGSRITDLRDALRRTDSDVVRPMFGGSVHRHTDVNGLSDVDVLMFVNESEISGRLPSDAISHMKALIEAGLPKRIVKTIKSGNMAVTVEYRDGMEIQVLPAIRRKSGALRVPDPDPDTDEWSAVTYPDRFLDRLTKVNQANKGRVIPTIKLVKGLAVGVILNEKRRLNGYHIEALAIEAFRNYSGKRDVRIMVIHFCEFASEAVMNPIPDPTEQSEHIDGRLGDAGSGRRIEARNYLRSMRNRFSKCKTPKDLDDLFDSVKPKTSRKSKR